MGTTCLRARPVSLTSPISSPPGMPWKQPTWPTSASPCLTTSWSQGPQTVSGALVGWITAGELVNLIISTFINSGRKRRKRSFEHNPRLVIQHNFLHKYLYYISHIVLYFVYS